jgi:hypothetical protein
MRRMSRVYLGRLKKIDIANYTAFVCFTACRLLAWEKIMPGIEDEEAGGSRRIALSNVGQFFVTTVLS